MMASIEEIRAFWESHAQLGANAPSVELPLRKLEIRTLVRYLRLEEARLHRPAIILDVGCGNGYATLQLVGQTWSWFTGVDYSPRMVACAQEARSSMLRCQQQRVSFQLADTLALPFDDASFDVVVTQRCLQNLPTWELWRDAVTEIARVLRANGRVVMMECSSTGLWRLNWWRRLVGKPPIEGVPPWHNRFLDDAEVEHIEYWAPAVGLRLRRIVHFASTYFFLTRVGWARLVDWPARLPAIGRFGYDHLYVLEKAPTAKAEERRAAMRPKTVTDWIILLALLGAAFFAGASYEVRRSTLELLRNDWVCIPRPTLSIGVK